MSRLFQKETARSVTKDVQPAAPMSLLGKGTRAANEQPTVSPTDTLYERARFAAQKDALRAAGKSGNRPRR